MKPIVFDVYCGLGGWSEAFIAEGYRAIGFDVEAHDYGNGGYPGQLVLRDARSISGAELVREYGVPAVIVANPPCQEFSYMAMPWSRAKEKMRKIEASPAEQARLCDLFNQCFRIQREVSEAAGHYVPMVVENVRGAQRWVGKAKWNFGSFYLWGDVPALMPIPRSVAKAPGISLRDMSKHNIPGRNGKVSFTDAAGYHHGVKTDVMVKSEGLKLPGNNAPRRCDEREVKRLCDAGEGGNRMNIHLTYAELKDGSKGFGDFNNCEMARKYSSKSPKRKQASAEIARIPQPLAAWIARCFKPRTEK